MTSAEPMRPEREGAEVLDAAAMTSGGTAEVRRRAGSNERAGQ
jgi:hypothetical protein